MVIQASQEFVPVFVDTLKDIKTTKRFKEKYGSYPVLRIHTPEGRDIAGRIDGNRVAGRIPVVQVLKQMHYAKLIIERQSRNRALNRP
ncbi:MAG: hypothetical protein AB8B50_07330 [Pirellulaceae bacterium]